MHHGTDEVVSQSREAQFNFCRSHEKNKSLGKERQGADLGQGGGSGREGPLWEQLRAPGTDAQESSETEDKRRSKTW